MGVATSEAAEVASGAWSRELNGVSVAPNWSGAALFAAQVSWSVAAATWSVGAVTSEAAEVASGAWSIGLSGISLAGVASALALVVAVELGAAVARAVRSVVALAVVVLGSALVVRRDLVARLVRVCFALGTITVSANILWMLESASAKVSGAIQAKCG